ncbi:mucin-5AC-like isoform X1 [Paramacrobiotus metropolitanus]|uniref:mucin-5AC-like isoform X1 n=1 Tax=Paramacrobiotus metropolitanus TaxID=2943436 RepID=UPI0024457BF4|nr:mucin-5AC-like isoform X1 [Paramacrobiotus metropolitanus]
MARIFSMCLALSSIAWQYQETTGQQVLPLGIFSFFGQTARQSPAPTLLTAAPSSSAQADTPALTRKLVDVGSPADVTFEMSCAGSTSRAALSCHCAGIGHRCADSASICNANGKCICDPSLSYQDGSKCVRYPTTTATTTTTCPSAITCPSTTSCPVCSATTPACPTTPTCPTVPTTTSSTTTTTMTTTTTTPLDTRCATSGILSGGGKCGGCVQLTLATTTTLQLDAGLRSGSHHHKWERIFLLHWHSLPCRSTHNISSCQQRGGSPHRQSEFRQCDLYRFGSPRNSIAHGYYPNECQIQTKFPKYRAAWRTPSALCSVITINQSASFARHTAAGRSTHTWKIFCVLQLHFVKARCSRLHTKSWSDILEVFQNSGFL